MLRTVLTSSIVFIDTSEIMSKLVANSSEAKDSGEYKTFNKVECEIAFNLCRMICQVIFLG